MTYLPRVEIPEWMKFFGNMCAYLFACSAYMLVFLIFISIVNIINVSVVYYVATGMLLIVTLIIVVKIESKQEPYDGW